MQPPDTEISSPRGRGVGRVLSVVLNSAIEALIETWLVLMFGGIAFGLVGGLFQKMLPSGPPGFPRPVLAESDGSLFALWDAGWFAVKSNRFALLFGVVFGLTVWLRLSARDPAGRFRAQSKARKVLGRLKENWFDLLVWNAFGAMISAPLLVWAQFSVEKWMAAGILDWVFGGAMHLIRSVFGESMGGAMQRLWDWYGDNQLKFAFWLFYLGAICDDLGLPNFKTLGRFLWRRIRAGGRTSGPGPATAPAMSSEPPRQEETSRGSTSSSGLCDRFPGAS